MILSFQLVIYLLKLLTREKQMATPKIKFLNFQLIKHNLQLVKGNSQLGITLFSTRKINLQLVKKNSQLVNLFSWNHNSQLVTHNLQHVSYKTTIKIAFSHSLQRFIPLKFDFNHVMVIRKIAIVNVQLVKSNFATHKHYHLKLSTRKFIILNFQLIKSNLQLVILFPVRKINLQLINRNS